MIDIPIRIMLFLWIISGCLLAGQYVVADEIGITLRAADGTELKSHLLEIIDEDRINEASAAITAGSNGTWNRVDDIDLSGAYIVWELINLISGAYAFNLLLLFGIPIQIVVTIVIGYNVLLARTIIGMVFNR